MMSKVRGFYDSSQRLVNLLLLFFFSIFLVCIDRRRRRRGRSPRTGQAAQSTSRPPGSAASTTSSPSSRPRPPLPSTTATAGQRPPPRSPKTRLTEGPSILPSRSSSRTRPSYRRPGQQSRRRSWWRNATGSVHLFLRLWLWQSPQLLVALTLAATSRSDPTFPFHFSCQFSFHFSIIAFVASLEQGHSKRLDQQLNLWILVSQDTISTKRVPKLQLLSSFPLVKRNLQYNFGTRQKKRRKWTLSNLRLFVSCNFWRDKQDWRLVILEQ